MPVPKNPLSLTPLQEAQEVGLRLLQIVDDDEAWRIFWHAVDVAGENYAEEFAPFEKDFNAPTELGDGPGPEQGG
jgi:hypothetical protein